MTLRSRRKGSVLKKTLAPAQKWYAVRFPTEGASPTSKSVLRLHRLVEIAWNYPPWNGRCATRGISAASLRRLGTTGGDAVEPGL